jgi:DNA-directed RNA polymerase alpha subunit
MEPFIIAPMIENKKETGDLSFTFTLSGVNYSIANALRRTILSNIQVVAFKTSPHKESHAIVHENTTRHTNEELLHRLSQIPIFHKLKKNKKIDFTDDLLLEINVENTSNVLQYVTTKDFKIKTISTNAYLSEEMCRKMFPPFVAPSDGAEYFIDFARLRPKVLSTGTGDKLHITCKFSVQSAQENSVYSTVSTCSYGYTVDENRARQILDKEMIPKWKNEEGKNTPQEIEFETKNWMLLDGRRVVIPNSFDFIIESIGVYSNQELVHLACAHLDERFETLSERVPTLSIEPATPCTIPHCFVLSLSDGFGEYTISPVLEYLLLHLYFEGASGRKLYSYCGFSIFHPQSAVAIFRIAFAPEVVLPDQTENTFKAMLREHLLHAIGIAKSIFAQIKQQI